MTRKLSGRLAVAIISDMSFCIHRFAWEKGSINKSESGSDGLLPRLCFHCRDLTAQNYAGLKPPCQMEDYLHPAGTLAQKGVKDNWNLAWVNRMLVFETAAEMGIESVWRLKPSFRCCYELRLGSQRMRRRTRLVQSWFE